MYRIGQEEIEACTRVIESKKLFKINSGAREVYHFEEEFKARLGMKYAVCMTSGKAALTSALIAMGVGPGDEVIVPAYTYIATAIAVTATGAIPVIAEVDETLTLDADDTERKISPHTKAIIPVHIQGFPSDMDRIMEIAQKHRLYVLEDACQSNGGAYHGKPLGTIGDAGTYSFNYFKIISAGEGGALVTNKRELYERALIYHDSSAIAYFGNQLDSIQEEQFCGMEFRVSEFTGAILREQLKKLNGIEHDLHRNRDALKALLSPHYSFLPSHDVDGDCATTLAFWFPTEKDALEFQKKAKEASLGGTRPIETGKHVYANWTPIMKKRGAFNPAFDPFLMEANKGLQHQYSPDMCPHTLDYLARAVYVSINPDWTEEQIEQAAKALR